MPESPAAGWTYTSSNGVSGRMRPFATAFSATPPARQRFGSPVRSQSAFDEVQVRLLEHRLERRGDVLVQRGQLGLRLARGAEHLLQPLRRRCVPIVGVPSSQVMSTPSLVVRK